MSDSEQIQAFANDLDKLVERYRCEFEVTFAGIVGTLQFKQFLLMQEAQDNQDNDE